MWWSAIDSQSLPFMRGHMLELQSSCHVAVENVTFVNSPFWFIHPIYSSFLAFRHLTIMAPSNVRQTDGIDPGKLLVSQDVRFGCLMRE